MCPLGVQNADWVIVGHTVVEAAVEYDFSGGVPPASARDSYRRIGAVVLAAVITAMSASGSASFAPPVRLH